jgi:polyhydroxyalkanoate synthase
MQKSAFGLLADRQISWYGEMDRAWRRWFALPTLTTQAADPPAVGNSPHDIVWQKGKARLLRYRRETPAVHAEAVVFCYALVNRPYILDLQPDRSVVRRYLEAGFEVYLLDWGIPTLDDQHCTLHDYITQTLNPVLSTVTANHATPPHLIGYCMGGTIATIATSVWPNSVRTLTLMATPIEFRGDGTLLQLWSNPAFFDVDAFLRIHGNCPAEFLQNCFQMLKPIQSFVEKYIGLYENLDDPQFLENYRAMEQWVNDNVPVAGATFREFVTCFFQQNQLVQGTYRLGEHAVDLAQITCPVLLLTAKMDHLVAPCATEGIRPYLKSHPVDSLSVDAGHVGLAVSSKAHRSLWPSATKWLAEHSTRTSV